MNVSSKQGMALWKKMAAASALSVGVMALIPGIAGAWSRWTGVDPILNLSDGSTMTILVTVPSEHECDLVAGDSIQLNVALPKGVTESSRVTWQTNLPDCGFSVGAVTNVTQGQKKNSASFQVSVPTTTGDNFPVRVQVSKNGEVVHEVRGTTKNGAQGNVNWK